MMLRFYEKGFERPFYSQRMSDGTLKLFAYYLLLHEKNPRQLVFIEEPENGLYHHYLGELAEEMKKKCWEWVCQAVIHYNTQSLFCKCIRA